MADLDWLKSRRQEAYGQLLSGLAGLRAGYAEIDRLRQLVFDFDVLVSREEQARRASNSVVDIQERLRLKKLWDAPSAPRPSPLARERKRQRAARARAALENAERRRLGLVEEECSEAMALLSPAPAPPVPIVEVEAVAPQGDHALAEEIARRAAVMESHGYACLGRRRSRRYEGMR